MFNILLAGVSLALAISLNQTQQTNIISEVGIGNTNEVTVEQEQEAPVYNFSDEEIYELAKLSQCEAGDKSIITREYVLCTVINRRDNPNAFDNTIHDVIYAPHQYSPVWDGSWDYKEPTETDYQAVYDIMYSGVLTSALYFEDVQGTKDSFWYDLNYLFNSEGMNFYNR